MAELDHDPSVEARFDLLQHVQAPDLRSRIVAAPPPSLRPEPIARQLAWAAAVVVIAVVGGLAAVRYAATDTTAVEVAGPGDQNFDTPLSGDGTPFVCPVTSRPTAEFVPPEPWPAEPSVPDAVWFGTDELWTVIDTDGHVPRKRVWWSANFPGGGVEERPPIEVVYERLDVEAEPVVHPSPGTNANTAADGWFMINGIDPQESGCWQVTANYKGASLSYTYDNR